MSFDWFSLAVFSSITASVITIIQKYALNKETTDPVAFGIYFQFLVAIIGLPFAVKNFSLFPFSLNIILLTLLVALSSTFGNLLYYFSLKKTEVSQTAILTSTSSLWLLLGGSVFLGEATNLYKIIGVLLVLCGIFIIYFKKNSLYGLGTSQILALFSAVFSGITGLLDKYLIPNYQINTYIVVSYLLQSIFTGFLVPASIKNTKHFIKLNWTSFLVFFSACLLNLGISSYLLSLKSGGEISRINPILQASIILTVILGIIFFNEKDNLVKKFLGTCVIFMGILLIK